MIFGSSSIIAPERENNRTMDAYWQPEAVVGNAPQTGMAVLSGSNISAAWAHSGTIATAMVAGQMVASYTPGAATRSTSSVVGSTFQPRLLTPAGIGPDSAGLDPICRYLVRMARVVGSNDAGNAFGIELSASASTLGAVVGATGAGIAVGMNGAGGWVLLSRAVIGGGFLINRPLTLPLPDTVMQTWEFRITPANSARAALLEVLIGGRLAATESWATGNLPVFGGAGAAYRFVPGIVAQPAGSTDVLNVARTRIIRQSDAVVE